MTTPSTSVYKIRGGTGREFRRVPDPGNASYLLIIA